MRKTVLVALVAVLPLILACAASARPNQIDVGRWPPEEVALRKAAWKRIDALRDARSVEEEAQAAYELAVFTLELDPPRTLGVQNGHHDAPELDAAGLRALSEANQSPELIITLACVAPGFPWCTRTFLDPRNIALLAPAVPAK